MKTIFCILLLFNFSFAGKAQINKKEVKSAITEVKLFLIGAELKRTGKVNLGQGTTNLVLTNISPKMLKESIQVTFPESVKITNVISGLKTITVKKRDSLRIARLGDSLEVYKKEIRRINSSLTTYEGEKDVIEQNKLLKNEKGGVTVAELEKLSEFYRKRLTEINTKIFEFHEQITAINSRMKILNDTIAKISVEKKEQWYEINVTVYSATQQNAEFILKYLVGGTGWSPNYDIRVKDVENQIDMEYKAKVLNQCGEDWNDVKLSFSSAMPFESQEAPVLEPWRLSFDSKQNYEGRLNDFRPNIMTKAEAAQKSGNVALPEGVEFAEVELSLIDFEFRLEDKHDIPSDGNQYLVTLTNYKLPVVYKYVAIPKVDKSAFLVAEVSGWEELNLIEGQTNIYFRGSFVGHSYLKPQLADEKMNISLGRDNKLIVTRVKVEDAKSDKLIGMNKREEFTYKITVKNTNPGNIEFTLYDQVPISQDDDIKVEIVDISGAEKDDYSGRLKWAFNMTPKESKEFTVNFAVKYPKNKEVKIRSDRRTAKYRAARFL